MAERKVFTVTDLGGGDGGKGGVVHKICEAKNAHTILKVGGAQGSHGVRTSRGQSFNFSQFGCGTFEGVRTHITDIMVMEPLRLMREAEMLRTEWRMSDVYDLLTIDGNSLCATPFHTIASRLKELSRKDKPKGTIGVGIGEAKLDSELHPELAIFARDLNAPDIKDKLEAVRAAKLKELSHLIDDPSSFWKADREMAKKEVQLLRATDFVSWIAEEYRKFCKLVKVVGPEFLRALLSVDGVTVVESSHGVLTDKYHGFHPNTSRLRTIPQRTYDLLKRFDFNGDVVKLGVTRAYQIRHGAGVMVTEDPKFAEALLPGSNKDENRWQGKVRVGPLDLVALRYSLNVCGGPESFDGIAVTWFDQIVKDGEWIVCDSYNGTSDSDKFTDEGEIMVRRGEDLLQLFYQDDLRRRLLSCKPNLTRLELPKDIYGQTELCASVLGEQLGVPVRMISFGPTEQDKLCI